MVPWEARAHEVGAWRPGAAALPFNRAQPRGDHRLHLAEARPGDILGEIPLPHSARLSEKQS